MPNVRLLYAAQFLTGLVFWYAIEQLFMQSVGISAFGVGVASVVYLTVTLMLEIPSGILADRWKRKYVLLLAAATLAVAALLLGQSRGLSGYIIGTVVYASYIAASSGAFQAAMYDTLQEQGRQASYDRYQGRAMGLFLIGVATGSLSGGLIAQLIGLREAYLLSVVPAVMAFIVLCFLHEPRRERLTKDSGVLAHARQSIRLVGRDRVVAQMALLLVVAGVLRYTQNKFGGLYYIGLGLPAVAFGMANTVKYAANAVGLFLLPVFGRQGVFRLVPVLFGCFLLFALAPGWVGMVSFMVASGLFAVVVTEAEAVINDQTPSAVRATMLSLFSFMVSAVMIPLSLLFGWLAERFNPFVAFSIFGALGIVYLLFWLVRGRPVTVSVSAHRQTD